MYVVHSSVVGQCTRGGASALCSLIQCVIACLKWTLMVDVVPRAHRVSFIWRLGLLNFSSLPPLPIRPSVNRVKLDLIELECRVVDRSLHIILLMVIVYLLMAIVYQYVDGHCISVCWWSLYISVLMAIVYHFDDGHCISLWWWPLHVILLMASAGCCILTYTIRQACFLLFHWYHRLWSSTCL